MIIIQDISVRGPSSAENCETRYTTWFMYDMLSNKEEDENEKIFKFLKLKDDDVIWVGVNWGTGDFLRVAVLGWGRLRAW